MENGLDKYAAISKAEDVLAAEYGATSLNIRSTISDYFDDQYRNSTYANENVLREADEIVAAWAEKQTLNEEMHGGYLELMEMNPKFDQGIEMLLDVWEEWKSGEMTEPEMIDEAKQDLLSYLSSVLH
jgi:uridine phosphorylase